jgi:hypothetical protein
MTDVDFRRVGRIRQACPEPAEGTTHICVVDGAGAVAWRGVCAIPGDETLTTYDYGPDSGPNNLWLRGVVVTAGGVSPRTCYAYDKWGNRISATSPRAGLTSCP